ncbi:alpha/beta hydrolase [Parahaliea mediterranea]|uniref:alpha/beta hydrolase n=1 Tax=Parahaliea mediterranea TaxID=651086 RepID=UPI000E2E6A75|nr:alpha/beta hydrolase [Parahaliea mediterranea]
MSLDDMPIQPPLRLPEGNAYGERVLAASRSVLETHEGHFDQSYGPDYWQKVDIFLPPVQSAAGLPLLVFAHGGSWVGGYKEWMAYMAPAVTTIPAIFVSVSYRLAPKNLYPLPFNDCCDAIRLVYERAESLGGDKSRIYVGGHSAGGHLMSLAAVRADWQRERNLPTDVIKGCLSISGVYDLQTAHLDAAEKAARSNALIDCPANETSASPIAHVSASSPPFVISVGELDFPPLKQQARAMRDQLEAAGVAVTFQDIANADHFATSEYCVSAGHPWLAEAGRFLWANHTER